MWYDYVIHTTEFSTHFIPWKLREQWREKISFLFTGWLQYAYLILFFRRALMSSLPVHIGQYIFFGLLSEHFHIKLYFLKKILDPALQHCLLFPWLPEMAVPWWALEGTACEMCQFPETAYSLCGRIRTAIPGSSHSGVLLLATIAAKIWWTSQNIVLHRF